MGVVFSNIQWLNIGQCLVGTLINKTVCADDEIYTLSLYAAGWAVM